MEDFPILHQILHTRHVDSPVLRWIQIRARVVWDFFLLKWCNLAHSECSKIRYYQPKINNFKDNKSTIVKVIRHMFHQFRSSLACKHKNKHI